ncbi:DUF2730 family protein [Hartmannibacter diazotrophicus]|uniref:DUF2730 family protein n=1 Tax=Hartmannibacter diazotrophicus TaxID=1482074 RepID=UPI000C1512B6|nr:DUF2730 family protein [Hartmannibacter diazotrophicus]
MEVLREWWPVIAFAATLLLGAGGWAIRMGLASKADLAAEATTRNEQVGGLERRIAADIKALRDGQHDLSSRTLRIETEIEHLPSADDFAELKAALGSLTGAVDASHRELSGLSRAVNRIEDHLLNRGQ